MYSHLPPLNIRVYGLRIVDKKVMIVKEKYLSQYLIKFPGGGLEYGEGTIDCLRREFKEELNCELNTIKHFYTTDFFQKSAWDERQVISIYYLINTDKNCPLEIKNDIGHFFMASKKDLKDLIHLPIDKIVVNKLIEVGLI